MEVVKDDDAIETQVAKIFIKFNTAKIRLSIILSRTGRTMTRCLMR